MKKYYPELLVFFQLSFILSLLITAPVFNSMNYWLLLELSGIILVSWAFFEIKLRNINIRPVVKADGVLVISGPYHVIRHPMYTATLLVMIALVGEYFSWLRLAFLIALLVVFIFKINYEEKALIAHFPDYSNYIKRTKRLFPYLF